jgi:hypothetical protein
VSGRSEVVAERRRTPRFEPAELGEPVLVVGSGFVNIGAHGLMLAAPVPLPTGTSLRLHLVVGGRKAAVDARVKTCVPRDPEGNRPWGVGVEFEDMDEIARRDLERVLVSGRRGRA